LDYVRAFWEGGAVAFGRVDEWSDVDAYLLVDNSGVSDAFVAVEEALRSLSSIKQKYEVRQSPWPGVSQAFYKLENASEYLVLDLAILTLESPEKFLGPEIHGNNRFYFNKANAAKPTPFDRQEFLEKLQERTKLLKARFDMFHNFVQKEINRENSLEALDYYRSIVLGSLVEALRIRHKPVHYDFKMRYIHYELPAQVIEKLKHLSFVRNMSDLRDKNHEAIRWFYQAIADIGDKEMQSLMSELR